MCPQQRNARWWHGSTATDLIIEGDIGPTAKGSPREHACEQNTSSTLATCKPIGTAKTPLSPTLSDGTCFLGVSCVVKKWQGSIPDGPGPFHNLCIIWGFCCTYRICTKMDNMGSTRCTFLRRFQIW